MSSSSFGGVPPKKKRPNEAAAERSFFLRRRPSQSMKTARRLAASACGAFASLFVARWLLLWHHHLAFPVAILGLLAAGDAACSLRAWIRERAAKRAHDLAVFRRIRAERARAAEARALARRATSLPTPALLRLARLAHHGSPAARTSGGEFVEGVAPDARTAVRAYSTLLDRRLSRGDRTTVLAELAALLEHGASGADDDDVIERKRKRGGGGGQRGRGSVVDVPRARALYLELAALAPGPHEAYEALESALRVSPDPSEAAEVRARMSAVAAGIAAEAKAAAEAALAARIAAARAARAAAVAAAVGGGGGGNPPKTTTTRTTGEDIWVLPPDGDGTRAPDERPTAIRSDAHNTHDSGVTRTVKASVDRLRESVGDAVLDRGDLSRAVRDLVRTADVPEDKRAKAAKALDAIERNDHAMSAAGITEVELLGLVWARIHHADNEDSRGVLRENLVDELAEAVENGKAVCASGRFSRVLDTLNGTDALVDIKPKWALSQEMIAKAGATYREKVDALSDADREAVEALDPTPEQAAVAEKFAADVKTELMDGFDRDYVAPGIMTREALEVETSKWLDAVVPL